MPRTQPCRKRLAIHARQLALKSRLQILRRSRRALLRGLEQARRSALAHHVHRIASMGARVLINGTWYNSHSSPFLHGSRAVHAGFASAGAALSGLSVAHPLATLSIPFTDAAAKSANAIALPLTGSSALSRFGR